MVSLAQLIALGLSASGVRARVRRGQLHRIHYGVYAVGHKVLGRHGRWMAAVLACGDGAVLSHRDAAALWGLRQNNRPRVEVTTRSQNGRRRKNIDAHKATSLLDAVDVTEQDRIPCTTVSRTLLDLADVIDTRGLEKAVNQAERLQLFDLKAVSEQLSRAIGRHGAPRLRAAIAADPAITRGELEERFLAICRAARIPQPRVNAIVEGWEVDFCWPERRLIVETDGYADHSTRRAFERDRRKERALVRAGWRVVRFTWREVTSEPARVAAELSELLG